MSLLKQTNWPFWLDCSFGGWSVFSYFFFIRLGIGILPVYFPWDWVVQPLLMIFLFCV